MFLARQSYRRRRLGDAARALPVVGAVLMLLPILWSDAAGTRNGLIYIFTVWAILIAVVIPISSRLSGTVPDHEDHRTESDRDV
jgi:hypothetical protein